MSVIGHDAVVQRFVRALQAGQLHHGWLLYGRQGIGKHTLALYLAQHYVCESRQACGQCHGCHMFLAGSHPDVCRCAPREGKRDLAIDQVRTVLDFLALSGSESERRVVIMDDADRMNMQAANALLKSLEEPAPGSLLLMVCHDLMRLPATIRSRCMLAPCMPLNDAQTMQVLQTTGISDAYISLAGQLADGCPGRVSCMLDDALAEALAEWQQLTCDAAVADVGAVEAWLRRHVRTVPHALMAEIVIRAHQPQLGQAQSFVRYRALDEALTALARWPGEVARHSLRAAPSFLALFLGLRQALRQAESLRNVQ